jgi:hypothetical protein
MLAHQGCSVSNTIETIMKVSETTTKTIGSKTEAVVAVVEFVTAAVADAEEAMESVLMLVTIVVRSRIGQWQSGWW